MRAPKQTLPTEAQSSQRESYCLLASALQHCGGTGPVSDLGAARGGRLVITLGVNHVAEGARLVVSIWGSACGDKWGNSPLLSFPPKSYCGIYATFLNLADHPGVRFLQVRWNMLGSGQSCPKTFFGFYVDATSSNV